MAVFDLFQKTQKEKELAQLRAWGKQTPMAKRVGSNIWTDEQRLRVARDFTTLTDEQISEVTTIPSGTISGWRSLWRNNVLRADGSYPERAPRSRENKPSPSVAKRRKKLAQLLRDGTNDIEELMQHLEASRWSIMHDARKMGLRSYNNRIVPRVGSKEVLTRLPSTEEKVAAPYNPQLPDMPAPSAPSVQQVLLNIVADVKVIQDTVTDQLANIGQRLMALHDLVGAPIDVPSVEEQQKHIHITVDELMKTIQRLGYDTGKGVQDGR